MIITRPKRWEAQNKEGQGKERGKSEESAIGCETVYKKKYVFLVRFITRRTIRG